MNKVILIALAVLSLTVASARAQGIVPDSDRDRFSFKDVPDGILRLDNRSGQVSVCAKRAAGWACEAVADDRNALEGEIARLQAENGRLKRELASRGTAPPDNPHGEPHSNPDGQALGLPSDADLDRVMAFLDKVWRRMIGMVQDAQKDMQKEQAEKDRDLHNKDLNRKDMRGAPLDGRSSPDGWRS